MISTINPLPTISFYPSEEDIHSVKIETERLLICSLTGEEQSDYESLFGNPKVMCTVATGVTKDAEYVQKRMQTWVDRWEKGDPFSGFAVYEKNSSEKTFIGHAVLGHGDIPGQSELAFLFLPEFWNKGYGKETIGTIIEHFAPKLFELGYSVEGAPFCEIVATSRVDNLASNRILAAFMKCTGQEIKYDAERNMYSRKFEHVNKQDNPQLESIASVAKEALTSAA